jgi:hypothetical protein
MSSEDELKAIERFRSSRIESASLLFLSAIQSEFRSQGSKYKSIPKELGQTFPPVAITDHSGYKIQERQYLAEKFYPEFWLLNSDRAQYS